MKIVAVYDEAGNVSPYCVTTSHAGLFCDIAREMRDWCYQNLSGEWHNICLGFCGPVVLYKWRFGTEEQRMQFLLRRGT